MIRRISTVAGMAPNLGPFSQAVVANGFVFTTGQVPARSTWEDQPPDFAGKVRQVLANLATVLEEAGSDMEHIVKCNGYLTDPAQLEEYNRVYAEVLGDHLPARTTCVVGMGEIALEIECIAAVKETRR
jgi:enamine deaminase RidA (YjgF/YER057c/UK114 family)